MPAYARSRIVDRNKIQVFHCWARCVRRAFLCGRDPKEGKDYEHRRQWIYDLLQELAGLFSLEIGFHAEMSNHFHLVLRSRPDLVKRWPKEKVVRSWLKIAKLKRGSDEFDWEPSPERVLREMADKKRVNRLRKRLSKVSWFMGTVCEHVARRSNLEDDTKGHFWEQRYGLRNLADEPAILVCGIYVDLNLIRAGETQTPETSRFTSAYDRIEGRKQRAANERSGKAGETLPCDRWLCELTLKEGLQASVEEATCSLTPWRASDKGLLPISLDDYLKLLDWTGRQVRGDKRGAIPTHLAPVLERLNINCDQWLETVTTFDARFGQVVGRVEQLAQAAAQLGLGRLKGIDSAAEPFD